MSRSRACGALIHDESIVMVEHREGPRVYWTLPGGGVEAGESFSEAAVREMLEETGLHTRAVRLLWVDDRADGAREECHLLELVDGCREPILGADPEECDLAPSERMLAGVAWRSLADLTDDVQVSRIISAP